jgi:hypothetical protein
MTESTGTTATDSPLLAFVLAVLPSMIVPTLTDLRLAQQAAREAVAAHQARSETDWLAIGQIVGFALSVLDTLRLSMGEDTSPSLKLKLRGNANAANRAVQKTTERLTQSRRPIATPEPELVGKPEPPVLTDQGWASGMHGMAAKMKADAATVSPEQRKTDALWINVLTGVANDRRLKPQAQQRESRAAALHLDGQRSRTPARSPPRRQIQSHLTTQTPAPD